MRKRHMASPHPMRRRHMAFLSFWMSSSSNEETTHGDLIQSPSSNEEVTHGDLIQNPSSNDKVTHDDLIHNPSSKSLIQWGGDTWRPHPKSTSNEEATCGDFIQSPHPMRRWHVSFLSKAMRIACGVIMMFCLIWKVPHPMRRCHLSFLSKAMMITCEEVPLVIFIQNSSSNEESTCGIWEDLHLMKVLSRGGFIWRWLKSMEWVPHNF